MDRWFSAWFLHLTFQHVLSNMLLYAAVAYQVEEKYGCTHVGLLFLISAMGGGQPFMCYLAALCPSQGSNLQDWT